MVSDKVFNTDGIQKIFSSDFAIISEDHLRVYLGTSVVSRDDYDLINNAAVFNVAPTTGQVMTVQVGTTPADILVSPTDAGIVAANIADINALEDILGDIVSVSTNNADVTTVATNIADVNTTATNIANVNTVAGNTTNINSAVANATNINAVVADASDIGIVATNIADVTAVADNETNIDAAVANATNINAAVANATNINSAVSNATNINAAVANETNINAVVTNETNINAVAADEADIGIVAGIGSAGLAGIVANEANINAVGTNIADVTTTATNIANVNIVATNIADVNTVADDIAKVIKVADDLSEAISEVETVANDLNEATSEIEVVANNIANVNTVGTAITNVNTVATDIANVNTTATDIANVNTTATNIAGVNTVATNIANVNTVAGNTSNINAAVANETNINLAVANATDINNFADTYFVSATAPAAPTIGDLWFDSTASTMKVYSASGWQNAGSSVNGIENSVEHIATAGQTSFTATYDPGYLNVFLNGVKLDSTDYTATDGANVVLDTGATVGDSVFVQSFGTFALADHYSKVDADARYLQLTGGTLTGTLTATDFIGPLNGAVQFTAKNTSGGTITKGQAISISGISGNTPTVTLADADATTMPAFGLAATTAADNLELEIITFGSLKGIQTDYTGWALGDTLYISTTSGTLTNVAPSGEAAKIQNIGTVERLHSSNGTIKVGGAGRSNATPNLNDGNVFIGNASNQAAARALVIGDTTGLQTALDSKEPADATILKDADIGVTVLSPTGDGSLLTGIDTYATTGVANPTITTNPNAGLGTIYSNSTDGTLWVCYDATVGANKWENVHTGVIIQPNTPPTNPTNTATFPANGAENSTFNFTFSGATDVTGAVTHYLVDNISNAGLSVTTAEVAVGTQHDFTCNAVTGDTPLTLRVRAKDEFGIYSSGVTINFTVLDTVYFAATGGTITTVGDYKYHTFTSSSTFTVTTAGNAPSGGVDYLTVGGGGGTGTDNSGGGGAGGYLAVAASTPSATGYSIVIGAGGSGNGSGGNNGGVTSAFGTAPIGGGRGSQWSSCVGGNGASGGGSCSNNNNPGDGTVGQGHDGGTAYNDGRTGGGGGAGSVGSNATSSEGGDGGAGLQWLNGSFYAGGGGGCGEGASLGGGEGQHGGGNGANGRDNGANGTTSGTANTGGGAGGPRLRNGTFNGGSGIVVVRYKWQN
jgi:hypothetical protein